MADVRDILEIDQPVAAELTKDSFLSTKKKNVFEKYVFVSGFGTLLTGILQF